MSPLKRKARGFAAVILLLVCTLCALGQQRGADEVQRLFLPELTSALELDARGLRLPLWQVTEDDALYVNNKKIVGPPPPGSREFRTVRTLEKGKSSRLGFLLIRMEPALAAGGPETMRAAALASYPKMKYIGDGSLKPSEYKQTPILRYSLSGYPPQEGTFLSYTGLSAFPSFFSTPGIARSLHALEAYFVRDGTWVTIRFASDKIDDEAEKFFHSLLDSVKFIDASTPSTSYDYFMLGSELYKRKSPAEAVAALEKALALEQKQRVLTQTQWRQLVMTLANALGATDDVARARQVLDYGVATEPTYAYFHHGLSRLYAHLGDLERLLAELEKALEYGPKDKSFQSLIGRIPDPLLDPVFARFKKDPRFNEAVKALKKKYKY